MVLHKPLTIEYSARLLRIHRHADGQIVGELENFCLQPGRTPDYKAISYVWGDGTSERTIVVNNCNISVLLSVYSILEALCDMPKQYFPGHDTVSPPWVWLDSICINQKDVAEVGQQVAYMADIFGKATSVIVWLGHGNARTDRGVELMKLMANYKEHEPISHPMVADVEAWKGYQEIAANPWWTRAWTLQESLVPQNVTYHCGSKSLSERQFKRAVLLTREGLIPKSVASTDQPWAALWNRRRIAQWYWSSNMPLPGDSINILALLAYTRHAQASDDRDYLYSLVGCVNTAERDIVGRPNYGQSVESIYTAFCREWIITHQSLDIICFTTLFAPHDSGSKGGLPSWVPDWRDRPSSGWSASNPVPLLVSQPANEHIGTFIPKQFLVARARSRLFSAAGAIKMRFNFSSDTKQLTCKGQTIDVLDGMAAMVDSPSQGKIRVFEPLIQSTSTENCSPAIINTPSTLEAFSAVAADIALSLVLGRADVYLQHKADVTRVLAQIKALLEDAEHDENIEGRRTRELLAWLRCNKSLLMRGVPLGEALNASRLGHLAPLRIPDTPWYTAAEHGIRWKFKKAATLRDMARRLAVTNNGHVGMVPRSARKGDLVCVLYGCSVPVALRPLAHDQYRLIGECYLPGFMEGQVIGDGRYCTQNYTIA